jgi:four helix bundle protein
MTAKSFEDLIAWRKAHRYVLSIYKLTAGFPKSELFGLTAQMRRAATSIPANIAEGFKKRGRADKVRIFNIAQESLEESRYYLNLIPGSRLRRCYFASATTRSGQQTLAGIHSGN